MEIEKRYKKLNKTKKVIFWICLFILGISLGYLATLIVRALWLFAVVAL